MFLGCLLYFSRIISYAAGKITLLTVAFCTHCEPTIRSNARALVSLKESSNTLQKKSKSVKTHYFMSSTDKNATENSFKNIPVIVEAGGTVHKTWKPLEALSSKNYNATNQHVLPSDEPLRIFPSLRSPIPFLSHLPTICAYNSKWLQHQCFFSMKKC